jgi:hypothetical protein
LSDLRALFNDLIRFEIELWNAVDAPLKRSSGTPAAIPPWRKSAKIQHSGFLI